MDSIDIDLAEEITMGYEGYMDMQEVSSHRWYIRHLVVFKSDDALLGFYYNDAKTEDALDDSDRFDAVPVPVFPVVGTQVLTTTYAPVKS